MKGVAEYQDHRAKRKDDGERLAVVVVGGGDNEEEEDGEDDDDEDDGYREREGVGHGDERTSGNGNRTERGRSARASSLSDEGN